MFIKRSLTANGFSMLLPAAYNNPTMSVTAVPDFNMIISEDETRQAAVRPILRNRGWRENGSDVTLYGVQIWVSMRASRRAHYLE